jgi:hypothetical protein
LQHLLEKFDGRMEQLEKLCLFGDPQQREMGLQTLRSATNIAVVPPYGIENAPSIKSIFEVEHLKSLPYFLDTQCDYASVFISLALT